MKQQFTVTVSVRANFGFEMDGIARQWPVDILTVIMRAVREAAPKKRGKPIAITEDAEIAILVGDDFYRQSWGDLLKQWQEQNPARGKE